MKILSFVCILFTALNLAAQTSGCTDPQALNYNPIATRNDGSCVYTPASVTPKSSLQLPSYLAETSGLISWNGLLWSHNDDSDITLYGIDTASGEVREKKTCTGAVNKEWEEISQDEFSLYIGDFGNNSSGNRTDLHLLRINKASLLSASPIIDTIFFSYSNQTSFTPNPSDNTDFDCEAFIVTKDSIYLFTKQWVSGKSALYSLPKIPGKYIANLQSVLNVDGLITGATYIESKKLIVLCGYSTILQPFLYLLYDFNGNDFTGGNKRKLSVSLPFYQIEAIATTDGKNYYLTNEYFSKSVITTPQQLHKLNLTSYLGEYLASMPTSNSETKTVEDVMLYPNPTSDYVTMQIVSELLPVSYSIENILGQRNISGVLTNENSRISTCELSTGLYGVKIGSCKEYLLTVLR